MTEQAFEIGDFAEAEGYPVLGPAYFSARRKAAAMVEHLAAEDFEPIIKKAADDFYAKLLDDAQTYLLSNAEDNVQGEIWRAVDQCVQDLLTGKDWALSRYALGDRYDTKAVRAAVAMLIPAELQDARLVEAEAEITKLKADLQFERDRRF